MCAVSALRASADSLAIDKYKSQTEFRLAYILMIAVVVVSNLSS